MLDEREFELINIVGAELGANQRDLSRRMNLSLGMTNMLVRRLVTKGYIRIRQLNKKKVEYLLTPKGFAEKMQKSVRYTIKTIASIDLVRQSVVRLIGGLYQEDVRKLYIYGSQDLVSLVDMVIRSGDWPSLDFVRAEDLSIIQPDGAFLLCCERCDAPLPQGVRTVNVVEALARDGMMQEQMVFQTT